MSAFGSDDPQHIAHKFKLLLKFAILEVSRDCSPHAGVYSGPLYRRVLAAMVLITSNG